MEITYIHHSSFVVREQLHSGQKIALLFDYFEGTLPEFEPDIHLYVFASHKHADHFNLCIFELWKKYKHVTYILGNDIKLNDKYLERNGIDTRVKDCIVTAKSHVEIELQDLTVETLRSTDQGVAFVVTFDGRTIYHAGDLNWWHWKGYTDNGNRIMGERYRQEIDRLIGRHIDVAFIPTDPRLEEFYDLGIKYFIEKVGADIIYPMHLWDHYETAERLAQEYPCVKNVVKLR